MGWGGDIMQQLGAAGSVRCMVVVDAMGISTSTSRAALLVWLVGQNERPQCPCVLPGTLPGGSKLLGWTRVRMCGGGGEGLQGAWLACTAATS